MVLLHYPFSLESMRSCAFGSQTTGVTSNRDTIVFSDDIGGTVNPLVFNVDDWPVRLIDQPTNKSINQSINQPIDRSIDQSIGQSINQQSINQINNK